MAASPAPRARCRVLAGSSSSCHPWSTTSSRLVGFGLQMVQPQVRGMSEPTAIVAPWRPRVLTPGMPSLDPGVERYVVRGGGLLGRRDHARRPDRARHPGGRPGGRAGPVRPRRPGCVDIARPSAGPSSLRSSAPCCLPTARMQPAFEAACGAAASTSAWSRRSDCSARIARQVPRRRSRSARPAICWWRRPVRR